MLYVTVPLILKGLADRHIWKKKQKQKPTLFLIKQCWSLRYKVPAYPHVEGVAQKRSLLPASIILNIQLTIMIIKIMIPIIITLVVA